MNISHEVPLALLNESRFFNDFDYALVHLLDANEQYRKYYMNAVNEGRTVYLDNSLYELGKAFDPKKYLEWIIELRPTYYIIPDTFWDTEATMKQAMNWILNFAPKVPDGVKTIGVCQGSCYEDIKRCYKFMSTLVDMVAFTFKFPIKFPNNFVEMSGEAFQKHYWNIVDIVNPGEHNDIGNMDTIKQAMMRYSVLSMLVEEDVIDTTKEHHLLGMQNTLLLHSLSKMRWITSIDTSNPIISGLMYTPYDIICEQGGGSMVGNHWKEKPNKVLADFFEEPVDNIQHDIIRYNVMAFRELAGTKSVDKPRPYVPSEYVEKENTDTNE